MFWDNHYSIFGYSKAFAILGSIKANDFSIGDDDVFVNNTFIELDLSTDFDISEYD